MKTKKMFSQKNAVLYARQEQLLSTFSPDFSSVLSIKIYSTCFGTSETKIAPLLVHS